MVGGWSVAHPVDETDLLRRITPNADMSAAKPVIRNRRPAVEHVLGMSVAGDTPEILMQGCPRLEPDDIQACLVSAKRLVGHERSEPALVESAGT